MRTITLTGLSLVSLLSACAYTGTQSVVSEGSQVYHTAMGLKTGQHLPSKQESQFVNNYDAVYVTTSGRQGAYTAKYFCKLHKKNKGLKEAVSQGLIPKNMTCTAEKPVSDTPYLNINLDQEMQDKVMGLGTLYYTVTYNDSDSGNVLYQAEFKGILEQQVTKWAEIILVNLMVAANAPDENDPGYDDYIKKVKELNG